MKTLVNASNRSPMVKEYLLKDPERWQWSVDWLRSKMTATRYGVIFIFRTYSSLNTVYFPKSTT